MNFYKETIQNIEHFFQTDIKQGLSTQEAVQRLQQYGYNSLPALKQPTLFRTFINQFQNPLIYTLLGAATIIFIFGDDKLDAFIISGVLFFNAILGTIQEERTRLIIESLKQLLQSTTVVVRNGIHTIIDIKLLVPGDIIIVQEGQKIPADARIIESNNMQVDESLLTGESGVILKSIHPLTDRVAIADQKNMLFKGTHLVAGSGKAIIVLTGSHTQMGNIYSSLETIKTDIPLKNDLEQLTHSILMLILGMCITLFIVGLCIGKPIKELLIMLTGLFICVVPEGLPVVLTLVLASGAYRMAKKQVLVKNMQAVEALGRTNVIIIDKTGTLTRNEMMVSSLITADNRTWKISGQGYIPTGALQLSTEQTPSTLPPDISLLATATALMNSTELFYIPTSNLFTLKGDPTEAALGVFAKKLGFSKEKLALEYTKIYEIPFTSDLQYHAAFYTYQDSLYCFVIGAPEKLELFLTPSVSHNKHYTDLLNEGLRFIAVAYKKIPLSQAPSNGLNEKENQHAFTQLIHNDLSLLGFCGLEDAIRPEVIAMIQQARQAGLKIVMATGDHQKTALHIAKKVGLWQPGDNAIDGLALEKATDDELLETLYSTTVYSRISPQHKMRLVQLFHHDNNIVAMTGDGINDVPSLLAADLGIAMGNIGTEVAKQAADLLLLDDSFNNIIHAIEQGRHIFYTLKRVILYFFSTNLAEILIVIFALGWELLQQHPIPLPLTAAQILWLNLVTDGFLDVGLSMEPEEPNLLDKKWLHKRHQLVDGQMVASMFFMAIPMGIVSLAVFLHYYSVDLAYARTMTLMVMAMFQWFNAWNCRSLSDSIFNRGFFANRWLIVAASVVIGLQMLLLYTPFMRHIFKTVPLSLYDWALILLLTSPIIVLEELRKTVKRGQAGI